MLRKEDDNEDEESDNDEDYKKGKRTWTMQRGRIPGR